MYQAIQGYIKERIGSGEWKRGFRIPTEKEWMERFGVSRITVSNALASLAQDGWIRRIQGRGSYVEGVPASAGGGVASTSAWAAPAASAVPAGAVAASAVAAAAATAAAAAAASRAVVRPFAALLLPSLADAFSLRLYNGIYRALAEAGWRLVLMLTDDSPAREAEAIRECLAMGAAGLIVFPVDSETHNEEIMRLKLERYPFVVVDRTLAGLETHYVGSDGAKGAALAVDHLYELGHRDIAIVSDVPVSTSTVDQRLQGYMKALKARGELVDPALMLTELAVDTETPAPNPSHPLERCVAERRASAYVTTNGRLALHLLRVAGRLGLRVPEDVSVVTFDDPSPSRELSFFTHIDQQEERMGRLAAETLAGLLAGAAGGSPGAWGFEGFGAGSGPGPDYRKIVLEPKLVPLRSTHPRST